MRYSYEDVTIRWEETHYPDVSLYLEKRNSIDLSDFLYQEKLLTFSESESIKGMISSPDDENYVIARTILENKLNELQSKINYYKDGCNF